jgi:phosphatidylserine decarboxylase
MATVWAGEILADSGGDNCATWSPAAAPQLLQGDYMGHFNMGSTVVLLGPTAALRWDPARQVGQPIKMGAGLGCCAPAA